MTNMTRRRILMAAAATGASAGAAAAPAPAAKEDADALAIKNRLLDVKNRAPSITADEKYCALLAAATAEGMPEAAAETALRAAKDGVSAAVIHEAIFQTAPYSGIARADAALRAASRELEKAGVTFPESLAAVTDANRFEKGLAVQTGIFGEAIRKMHEGCAEGERALIVEDLSAWCFGDYYTRKGLSVKDRELVTFTAIAAMGGCEPQLKAHIGACLKEGFTKQNLIDALQAALPYLGFPRTLNALGLVRAA